MQNLWGEEVHPQPAKHKTPTNKGHVDISLTAQDCFLFGHSWTPAGMAQEKACRVCGIKGYCPGCTPLNHSPNSLPFFCTRHSEGKSQA